MASCTRDLTSRSSESHSDWAKLKVWVWEGRVFGDLGKDRMWQVICRLGEQMELEKWKGETRIYLAN